jgi:hypothetical protein
MTRCEHENVDHVGPDPSRFGPHALHAVEHLVCLDCGKWLSLGPSNDEHEAVRVEIRAAQLARQPANSYATSDAWAGWYMHEADEDVFPTPECWAGWLAREIAKRPTMTIRREEDRAAE